MPVPQRCKAVSDRAYVVCRYAFSVYGMVCRVNEVSDSASLVPVRAFVDPAAAEALVVELMRVARRTANPFVFLGAPSGADVRALKMPFRSTPSDRWQTEEWHLWYETQAPHLTDEQREKLWSLFDARPLFGIYEVPLGDE